MGCPGTHRGIGLLPGSMLQCSEEEEHQQLHLACSLQGLALPALGKLPNGTRFLRASAFYRMIHLVRILQVSRAAHNACIHAACKHAHMQQ